MKPTLLTARLELRHAVALAACASWPEIRNDQRARVLALSLSWRDRHKPTRDERRANFKLHGLPLTVHSEFKRRRTLRVMKDDRARTHHASAQLIALNTQRARPLRAIHHEIDALRLQRQSRYPHEALSRAPSCHEESCHPQDFDATRVLRHASN